MTLHIYGPTARNTINVRARCPVDNSLRRGRLTIYYDTRRLALDCGVSVNMDCGEWYGHRGPRGGRGLEVVLLVVPRQVSRSGSATGRFYEPIV